MHGALTATLNASGMSPHVYCSGVAFSIQHSTDTLAYYVLDCSTGFASSLNCPQNHYPFTCATCFTIPEDVLDFNSSLAFCQIANGTLITVENSSQMLTLGRYLEGLNDTRTLWTGYRYVMGSRVDVAGQAAPEVLQDSGNFVSGTTTGDTDTCIGVQEGRFVNVPCSERRPFICLFQYSGELSII